MENKNQLIMKESYEIAERNLLIAIDIAIKSLRTQPPENLDKKGLEIFVSSYEMFKDEILSCVPRFKNLKGLKQTEDDVFIFFNEANNSTVSFFWEEIKNKRLPYKRVNRLDKVLKSKKIKNREDYDTIIDLIVPYQQQGLIDEKEVELLNNLISEFESSTNNVPNGTFKNK